MGLEIRPVTDVVAWLQEATGLGPASPIRDSVGLSAVDEHDGDTAVPPLVELDPRPTLADVEFVFLLARRMARGSAEGDPVEDSPIARWVATGTVDAMLWVLGATDVAPSGLAWHSDMHDGLRDDDVLSVEDVALTSLRAPAAVCSRDYCYYGGASDAVCFARGIAVAYWWGPLPEPLRRVPPRDVIGRALR